MARDLVVGCALLAGYVWLAVLSARVRSVHRRLAVHVCREAVERTQPIPAIGRQRNGFED